MNYGENTKPPLNLLQEILLKTHANLHTLKSTHKIQPWLFALANNTVVDFYRHNASRRNIDANSFWPEDNNQSVLQTLSPCIQPFINALPNEYNELLTQIDLNGVSQKKYAATQGINYSTLKSKVHKARHELRGLFEKCCVIEVDAKGNIFDYTAKSSQCGIC